MDDSAEQAHSEGDGANIVISERMNDIKSQIRILFDKLATEPSLRVQADLRSQIEELRTECRGLYSVNTEGVENTVSQLETLYSQPFEGNASKMVLNGVCNQEIGENVCVEALIEKCKNILVRGVECRNSLVLIDVEDSEIYASAGQIRLINCKNVLLKVKANTGIFLQDSSGIRVGSISGMIPKVRDFSSPKNSMNYVILP